MTNSTETNSTETIHATIHERGDGLARAGGFVDCDGQIYRVVSRGCGQTGRPGEGMWATAILDLADISDVPAPDRGEWMCDAVILTASKEEVSSWETVDGYEISYDVSDGWSEGAENEVRTVTSWVSVEVGEHLDRWFIRTTDDDGGGTDESPDGSYSSREDAVEAASAFALAASAPAE
jgi:hypothetical protein